MDNFINPPESTELPDEVARRIVRKFPQIEQEVIAPLLRREIAIAFAAFRTPAASPVAPPESELDKEITRWQKAIYDLCREESGDDTIDGGGCDSGDPLDFTLAEISEAFGIIKDKLASPVAGGSAETDEVKPFCVCAEVGDDRCAVQCAYCAGGCTDADFRAMTAHPSAGGSAEKCYLCGVELQGQRKQLQCEKGAPITVCEDCYDDASE